MIVLMLMTRTKVRVDRLYLNVVDRLVRWRHRAADRICGEVDR